MGSTETTRRMVGSLRLIGVTAAVAAGIAGFATVDAVAAPQLDLSVVAQGQACEHASDRAKERSVALASCATDQDPADGVNPISGEEPVFGEARVRGRR